MRLWALLAGLFGLAALATVVGFASLPEVKAAGTCLPGDAVIRFEFARSQPDLEAIFGPPSDVCRAQRIAALDAVNTIDVWVFIPAYTAFVSFAALFLSGGTLTRLAWAAIAVAVVAAALDYVETLNLLAYTPGLAPEPERLIVSSTAAWAKFFALAVNSLILAAICFTQAPRRPILGALLCLPIIGVSLMFVDLHYIRAQTLAFTAAWLPLLVMAARAAVLGR
jgi:hypothetical protein